MKTAMPVGAHFGTITRTLLVAVAVALVPTPARADDNDALRKSVAEQLLDSRIPDDQANTFSAFYEACGSDCEVTGWGGCSRIQGKPICEAKVKNGDGLHTFSAVGPLIAALTDLGGSVQWLEEHRFETPAKAISIWNVTFRWDPAKQTLTVLSGKKPWKTVKPPKLKKGLKLTSVAIWYRIGDESAGNAVLRLHGEGDDGQAGDSVVIVEIPPLDPPPGH